MDKKKSKSKSKPQTLPSPSPPPKSLKPNKSKSKSKSKKSKTPDETLRAAIDYDSESSLSPSQKLLKLIAPFPKDHLITLLSTFAITNSTLLDQIRIAADVNVCHRRLFVYGIEGAVSEEDLRRVFGEYGELEDCHVVVDRETRAKKGYGFVRFRERRAAALALRERVKRVGNGRVVQCVLAAVGVGRGGGGGGVAAEVGTRKIHVSHVPKDADPLKLSAFFRKFGDIEEGPLGFDYKTGKSRGFAIFVYRTVEGARKALEEPLKIFEGHQLYCKKHEEVKKDTVVPTAPAGAPQQMLPPKTQEASSSFPQSMLPKTVQDVSPQTVQAQASPLMSAPGLPPGTGQPAPQQAMHGLSHVYPAPSHVAHPQVPSHAAHLPPHLLAAVAAAQNLAMYNHNPGLSTYYGGMLGAPSNSPYFPGRVDGMVGESYGASQPYGYCVGYGDSRLRRQFEVLTQGSMSVDQYAEQFINLSRFATDLVTDEERQCRRFEMGLRPAIRDRVVALRFYTFADLLESARAVEENWEITQKEWESRKSKRARMFREDCQAKKQRSSNTECGPEVLGRSASVGSSKGSKRPTRRSSVICHLCEQLGHVVSNCPMLSQARASVSYSRPQQQGAEGSRSVRKKSVVCYRCDELGHFSKDCPMRPKNVMKVNTGSTPTQQSYQDQSGQTSRPPAQSSRGGGREGGYQRGQMTAIEIVDEPDMLGGYQEAPVGPVELRVWDSKWRD